MFRGTAEEADAYRAALVADVGSRPLPPGQLLTVAELLDGWLTADHPWKPSTRVGYRSNVRALLADPIARTRVVALHPHGVRTAFTRWSAQGHGLAVVGG